MSARTQAASTVASDRSVNSPLRLFFAVDDGYAMPLAVTLCSALWNLTSADCAEIIVADQGIRAENRQKLARIVEEAPVEAAITFVPVEESSLEGLPTSEWHGLATYVRLLIDRLVPAEWERVLFLDADTVVRDDLGQIYRQSFGTNLALGVVDYRDPTVASRQSLRRAYLEDLGLSPDTVYCNAGVMVVNLAAWRAEDVGRRCIEFVHRYVGEVEYKDQDALNGIIAGRWGRLDPRWNVEMSAVHFFGYPHHDRPEHRAQQARLRRDPAIVHFTGASKPWHYLYRRGKGEDFFRYLAKSRWFAPAERQRWVWGRRLSHFALRTLPDPVLTAAREAVEGRCRRSKASG